MALIAHVNSITIKFIDSYQFINSSLDAAVKTINRTPFTTNEFNNNRFTTSKRIFPYNLATSLDVLQNTTAMLPIWNEVNEESYNKAVELWQITGCRNLLEYMLIYLKLDVFLLADFFNQFRKKSIAHNGLEPLNYFGIQGMSWSSALLTLKEHIHLLTETVMYNFFESGIRGDLTFLNKHHVYSDDNTELLYIDINNLFGYALSQKLLFKNFKWIDNGLDEILEECKTKDLESLTYGYTVEFDLFIRDEFHDRLSDLPPAAVYIDPPSSKVKELLLTLDEKK